MKAADVVPVVVFASCLQGRIITIQLRLSTQFELSILGKLFILQKSWKYQVLHLFWLAFPGNSRFFLRLSHEQKMGPIWDSDSISIKKNERYKIFKSITLLNAGWLLPACQERKHDIRTQVYEK